VLLTILIKLFVCRQIKISWQDNCKVIPILNSPWDCVPQNTSFDMVTYNCSQNEPCLKPDSIGGKHVSLTTTPSSISCSISSCNDSSEGSCSCSGQSAPLGSLVCHNGVWTSSDNGFVTGSESVVAEPVEVQNLNIHGRHHVIDILFSNDLYNQISSSTPIIQVDSGAKLSGSFILNFTETINFNVTDSQNITVLLITFHHLQKHSNFSSYQVIQNQCQNIDADFVLGKHNLSAILQVSNSESCQPSDNASRSGISKVTPKSYPSVNINGILFAALNFVVALILLTVLILKLKRKRLPPTYLQERPILFFK